MDVNTILDMAAECEKAHSEFVEELDRISTKYGVPKKDVYKIAMEVFQEVDIDDTDNS